MLVVYLVRCQHEWSVSKVDQGWQGVEDGPVSTDEDAQRLPLGGRVERVCAEHLATHPDQQYQRLFRVIHQRQQCCT